MPSTGQEDVAKAIVHAKILARRNTHNVSKLSGFIAHASSYTSRQQLRDTISRHIIEDQTAVHTYDSHEAMKNAAYQLTHTGDLSDVDIILYK